ncbi:hypothetical protein HYZ97_00550 [Candidatus Pacearchaeota archaeon]|nr:hypothetical protein [Candidatus Pacearchaeota archaeon]
MAEQPTQTQPAASRDEQIGFHKGALTTLIGERNELVRLIQITDSLVQSHIKALEELGIKLDNSGAGTALDKKPVPKK